MARVIGGESGVVREHQQVLAHLMEGSRGRIGGRRVLVAGEQSTAARLSRGGGKPAAAVACQAPAELEVEDEFQGLVCKNRKV